MDPLEISPPHPARLSKATKLFASISLFARQLYSAADCMDGCNGS
jgi:hypothetical protein